MNVNRRSLLYNGFIELVNSMGNDLTVVNAARCSFNKEKEHMDFSDEKLIKYLAKNKHWSPFRHVQFQFLCQLPEVVTRQFYKHVVGIAYCEERQLDHAWNEVSGRYIDATALGFWIPEEFRIQSKDSKQASERDLNETIDQNQWRDIFFEHQNACVDLYHKAINAGICKEQARSLLTTAFNTKFLWTCSLQALVNFIKLREHKHAQGEIQLVAGVLKELAYDVCPLSFEALLEHDS